LLNVHSRRPPAAGHGCGKCILDVQLSCFLPSAGIQVIYLEPVRDPVPDAGFEGKSLILKDILLDFFHKFIRFRLPIKNARVSGQGAYPGFSKVPFSSRDRFPNYTNQRYDNYPDNTIIH
jgi:hypothetical protein